MRAVRRALRTLRAGVRGRPPALVLVYHRVADVALDPWSMCVRPANFAEHLDVLARSARPLPATRLVEHVAAGTAPPAAVAVTFDDGYADLLHAARPLLARAGVPATVFVTTGAIGSRAEFWWDALERALLHDRPLPPVLRLPLGAATAEWPVAAAAPAPSAVGAAGPWRAWDPPPSPRHAVYRAVWEALLALGTADRDRAVGALLDWAELDPGARPSHRTLTDAELDALAAGDLIEIGAHTHTHPVLAALAPAERDAEITGGRDRLQALTGRDIRSFAYPFGKPEHVGAAAREAVRAAGFRAAFLNVPGTVTRATDPCAVPRVFVEDMDGDAFGRLLRRTAGIRTG